LGSSKSPRQRPNSPALRLRKNGALAIGCVAGVALVVLARSPLLDREADSLREIELITRSVESNLQRAWETGDFRPSGAPLAVLDSPQLLPAADASLNQEVLIPEDERTSAFDALLAESENYEFQGEHAQALLALKDARASSDDPRRWVLADLRSAQLAVKLNNPIALAQALSRLTDRLDGQETLGGISVLATALTAALSIGPTNEPALLRSLDVLKSKVALALARGHLPLPQLEGALLPEQGGLVLRMNLERSLFFETWGRDQNAGLVAAARLGLQSDAFQWLALQYGAQTPSATPRLRAPRADRPAGAVLDDQFLFTAEARPSTWAAWVLSREEWESELRAWWSQSELLPKDLRVTLLPEGQSLDEHQPRALRGTPFGVVAWLANPAEYRERARSAFRWMRVLLHALGVMCALLGLALHRQHQRELAVQHLKSEFVANVSHELRTPLSSILLMAENLSSGKVGEETQRRYHELILRESQRLRRLVDDVLDFSRLDRGEGPRARIESVSLPRFGGDLRAELEAWAVQHQAEFSWTEQGLKGDADLDSEALRRAVFNLADNALRHSGSKQIGLQLEANQKQIHIRLRDHGKGLPEGSEDRIFRPFEQLDTDSTAGKGAGLGLAIVAEIARAHGGQVEARNVAPGGALFTITLPRYASS
jgi:signal transduction histidine kinase